ncbi:MAG: Gfo/Idh/MocA family oxidoreductase [Chloroflexota bacterium]
MTANVRFGIIGTGAIAGEFADGLAAAKHAELVAVASRSAASAAAFAAAHPGAGRAVARAYGSYEELLADPAVDAVYVATPHPQHPQWAMAVLDAGKHVLCEKPIAVNADVASRIFEAARERGLVAMEAFAFRFHPQTQKLLELISSGAIGRLRALDIAFTYDWPEGRAVARRSAGGGILDVGTYCTSLAALIVAAAQGGDTAEATSIVALADLHPVERTDVVTFAVARYPDDVLAQLSTGVGLITDDHIRVYGTAGQLAITIPCWRGPIRDLASQITLTPNKSAGIEGPYSTTEAAEVIFDIPGGTSIFTLEADGVASVIRGGSTAAAPYAAHSLANLRALDAWRAAVGVAYDDDIEAGEPVTA